MRLSTLPALAGLLAMAACSEQSPSVSEPALVSLSDPNFSVSEAGVRNYRITLENMTTGQVFSPGVIATHTKDATVWQQGQPASEGIRLIAEDGDQSTAVADLTVASGVFDVVDITTPTNRIGGLAPIPNPQMFEISARGNANRLSLAVMLICTNDGFTGLSGVKLPGGSKPDVYEVGAWDAGSEQNNELFNQIVDPCGEAGPVPGGNDGNGRVATIGGVIVAHSGIQGRGDLTVASHGWQFPVARITIQRIK
ncbi:MAG: spondin domain-containing protein [Fimbriimonadales bacterium]